MTAHELAAAWYDRFARYAADLYPDRYTPMFCAELAEQAMEVRALAAKKGSTIVVHNYLYPELHEIADLVGDSLGLSLAVRDAKAPRVDFESVFFMGATAKLITGDATRVYVADHSAVLGCSLVFGTDPAWVEGWRARNQDGIIVTYINSDAWTKAQSDYVSTSRNTDRIIVTAARQFPGKQILVLPDKYLGFVMKQRALTLAAEEGVALEADQIEVYTHEYGGFRAACYVHEAIGERGVEDALDAYPDAELMIHPECGCASSCLFKVNAGVIPRERAYFLSTEGMVRHARSSPTRRFIVATEKGMVYRLRKELPEKEFLPVSLAAECRYMKANTLAKLERSLREDRLEVVLCDDGCDPQHPYEDDRVIHIPRSVAAKAKVAIDRMLEIS